MLKICRSIRLALPLLITALVFSCAHTSRYVEPALPDKEVAVIQASLPVWIIAIDGQKVSYDLSGDNKVAKITPGPHTVTVSYKAMETRFKTDPGDLRTHDDSRRISGMQYVPVNLIAKPGHTYSIQSRREEKKWYLSVADFTDLHPPASDK